MTSSFQYNPYVIMSASTASESSFTSLGRASTYSSDEHCDGYSDGPKVVYHKKHVAVPSPSFDLSGVIDFGKNAQHILPDELAKLVHALIVDPVALRCACSAHGGLFIGNVLQLMADDIRGMVLLEVIVSDEELVWDLATQTVALQSIYDIADCAWKCRLHKLLIPRLGELCYHPQGNYLLSHMLRAFHVHADPVIMLACSTRFSDATELVTMCQHRSAVCVAVAWASAVPSALAISSVLTLLQSPKASFVFYRLSMSGVAYKVVASLLRQMAHTEYEPLISTVLVKHIRGARYSGKIRNAVCALLGHAL